MRRWYLLSLLAVIVGLFLIGGIVTAQDGEEAPLPVDSAPPASRLHPRFALLDAAGVNVLESGQPLSTMQTCGECHDTAFISEHSQHSQVPANTLANWNSITYRYLTTSDESMADLDVQGWFQNFGERFVGGGSQAPFEMNCFLCHTAVPDNQARTAALQAGDFAWANTATLGNSGILAEDGRTWNPDAFDESGWLKAEFITIQDPTNLNCGQCHGAVQNDSQVPLNTPTCDDSQWRTFTTGQIVSPQRIANSALNLAGKAELSRSWDVHAERLVNCVDCHYSLNNPTYYKPVSEDHPEHLVFDPRRLDISEYLYRPLHDFANGEVLSEAGAVVHNDSVQPCQACHNLEDNHDWLPYKDRHVEVLACQGCHIPTLNAPALQSVDWTVLQADATPTLTCRGQSDDLITGYQPVLLTNSDEEWLAPYNLVSAWYWVFGADEQPVPFDLLQAAWFEGESYAPEILTAFDANQDGALTEAELLIDTPEKEALIQARLEAQGLNEVHIVGTVKPFSINHGVAYGEWAVKDCDTCHTDDSRVSQAMLLSANFPGGVMPSLSPELPGELITDADGAVYFQPDTELYVLGHHRVSWVDWLGILLFLGTFAGVILHGGLRFISARNNVPHDPALKPVYMYSVYERQWHWLQTVVIFILIFTGLIIHKPDLFGIFSFRYVVQVHNISAVILLVNAALAAFYHLASGEIRQFLPRPYGFFDQAFLQPATTCAAFSKGILIPSRKRHNAS
jgi:hypothetical protein